MLPTEPTCEYLQALPDRTRAGAWKLQAKESVVTSLMNQYPDGFYLWRFKDQSGLPIEIAVSQAHMPVQLRVCLPTELVDDGMTLTLLIPATNVVVEALTVYTILCGVDENRIEAAELLDKIKAASVAGKE